MIGVAGSAHPVRLRRPRQGSDFELLRASALGVAVGVGTAAVVAFAQVPPLLLVMVPVGLAVAFAVFASSAAAAVLLGLSIPEITDVTGGHLGLHVAASDVLLVLVGLRLVAEEAAQGGLGVVRALRPVRLPFIQYGWLILVLLALHPGFDSAVKSFQRFELFGLPLLAGAYFAMRGQHMLVLRAYVLATAALAVTWPLLRSHGLAAQLPKNTTGQLIACAIVLLVAVPALRRLLWCIPPLLLGLALTASRGSVLAVVVGVLVLSIMAVGPSRRVILTRTAIIVLTGVILYQAVPSADTARLTSLTGSACTSGAYNIQIRFDYAHDAEQLIAAHPWTGVGVGNYLAGDPHLGTQTTDPHDVVLLEAAEGGYVFAASFVLMILGAAAVLWRLRRSEFAAAAVAVLLATVAHGLVDVYWVRGLPVLGFLLVGMACGLVAKQRARA